MEKIIIEKTTRIEKGTRKQIIFYSILFIDDNGVSALSKTKNKLVAENKYKKFNKNLKDGILLKPEKSIWKYEK